MVNIEKLVISKQEQNQYIGLIFSHSQWDTKAFCVSGLCVDKECGKNVYEEADKKQPGSRVPHLAEIA